MRLAGKCGFKVHDADLGGKLPEGMLLRALLQWYYMTKYKVHSSQHLLAQLLQMLPYILGMWLWCLHGTT